MGTTRLRRSRLAAIPAANAPGWLADPSDVRIAHLGPGPFHRAHQATITDDACATSDQRWGIAVCAGRGLSAITALQEQDGLFTTVVRGADETTAQVHGVIAETGPRARFADLLANAEITIATLTVTEQHYPRPAGRIALDGDDPLVRHDLEGGDVQRSLPGLLHAGLHRRWKRSGRPISILSCDNLRSNGTLTRELVRSFAERVDADAAFLAWLDDDVTFPNTVVDRLVPTPSEHDRQEVARVLGVRDDAAVSTEDYCMWIIEDVCVEERPPWELGGARFVGDTTDDERIKLHVLNGAHSLLATVGLLAGCSTVGEAMGSDTLARAIEQFHRREVLPSIGTGRGLDPTTFASEVRRRFANPAMNHALAQIAQLGSLKLAERIVPLVHHDSGDGAAMGLSALAVAAWLRLFDPGYQRTTEIVEPHGLAVTRALEGPDRDRATTIALHDAGLIDDGDLAPFVGLVADLLGELRRDQPITVTGRLLDA